MTEPNQQTTTQHQPRGAGSGANANVNRSRNIVDWPPEPKSHAEHVEELEQQAQDNADHNNEMNEIQTEQAKKLRDVVRAQQGDPANDDEERERVREAFVRANDPDKRKAALKGEMDARAKRDRARTAVAAATK